MTVTFTQQKRGGKSDLNAVSLKRKLKLTMVKDMFYRLCKYNIQLVVFVFCLLKIPAYAVHSTSQQQNMVEPASKNPQVLGPVNAAWLLTTQLTKAGFPLEKMWVRG